MSYLKGEEPLNGGVSSGVGAGLGYGLGKLIEIPLDINMNPNYKNYEWIDIGLGITKQPANSITPSTTGSVVNSVPSEWTSKAVEEKIKDEFKKQNFHFCCKVYRGDCHFDVFYTYIDWVCRYRY